MAQIEKYLHVIVDGESYAISLYDNYPNDAANMTDYISFSVDGKIVYAAAETDVDAVATTLDNPDWDIGTIKIIKNGQKIILPDVAVFQVDGYFDDDFGGGGHFAGPGIDDRWFFELDGTYVETGGSMIMTADTNWPYLWQVGWSEALEYDIRTKIKISDLPAAWSAGNRLEAGFDHYFNSVDNNVWMMVAPYDDGTYVEGQVFASDYQYTKLVDTNTDIHLRIKCEYVSGTTYQFTTYWDQDNGDSPSWTQQSQASQSLDSTQLMEMALYCGITGGTPDDVSFYYIRNV